jgi:hypothetical protein
MGRAGRFTLWKLTKQTVKCQLNSEGTTSKPRAPLALPRPHGPAAAMQQPSRGVWPSQLWLTAALGVMGPRGSPRARALRLVECTSCCSKASSSGSLQPCKPRLQHVERPLGMRCGPWAALIRATEPCRQPNPDHVFAGCGMLNMAAPPWPSHALTGLQPPCSSPHEVYGLLSCG